MSLTSWLKPRSKTLVGVDIGSSSVKVAALKQGNDGYQLEALGSEALPPDTIVDGVIISKLPVVDAINSVFKREGIRNSRIATSISGHSVIVKKVTLPEQSEQELDESIRWEAEQYVPFDISDVNLDYQVVQRMSEIKKMEVILVAAKSDKIGDQTSVLSMAGKLPCVVDIDAFATQNVYEMNYQPEDQSVIALLNIGATVMNINILKGKSFLFTRDIAVGGNHYSAFLQKNLNISYEDAEEYKRGNIPEEMEDSRELTEQTLSSVSENLSLEVQKTLDYFRTTSHSEDIQEIYISGGACRTQGLREHLEEHFHVPVHFLNPFKKIRLGKKKPPQADTDEVASDFAVAVGLALRSAQDR